MLDLIAKQPHIIGWIAGRDKLTPLHSEWIKYIWTSGKSVSLMAHRGSYKSTAIVVIGAVWYMLFNPDIRIAVVRKTYADAVDATATIAKIMEMPEIRELFRFAHGEYPEFTRRREGTISFNFKKTVTPEGSVTAYGLNSPLTGRHFDFILCDDISTLKDRLYRAEREYTMNIWRELSTNIIDRGHACCYIGTPWSPQGVESIIPPPKKYSIHDCNLISLQELEQIRATTTPSLFAANYELEFRADDDALFKDPIYSKWQAEEIETVRAQIDAAYGMGDTCALTISARRKNTGIIQMAGFTSKLSIAEWMPKVAELCRLYKVRKVYVEKQSDRGWTASMLKKEKLNVCEYSEDTKKQHKISTFLYEIWPSIEWAPESDDEYMEQIVDWTAEAKTLDDAPDSAASLCRACFSKRGMHSERWRL
jgi:hypothetical protein